MRKVKVRLSAKKDKTGYWTYTSIPMGAFELKKGQIEIDDKYNTLSQVDCVKIGGLIYDIVSAEDGRVVLAEPIQEDFTGELVYEESLPIKLKKDSQVIELMIDLEDKLISKVKREKIPLNKASKELKQMYLKELEENGKQIPKENVFIYSFDEMADKKSAMKNQAIRQILELVIHLDMEPTIEGEVLDLWEMFGVEKGNYVDLAKLLRDDRKILSDIEDVETLKFTIDAIKLDKDVQSHVIESKLKSTQFKTQMLLANMSKHFENVEDFKTYTGLGELTGE